jgi:6-pyruvoyl-tetrahydropterin synthase related domain
LALTDSTLDANSDTSKKGLCAPAIVGSGLVYPLLIVMATAFAMIVPFFVWSNPSGHDFEFHVNSWMEVLRQWKQGVLLPGWAGLAQFGNGEARFIFYPPISWTAGAFLGALLPWRAVPGAYVWMALTLSGFSMFCLARRYLSIRDSTFVAASYIVSPYYVVIVYWRSAMAELLAGALLPLLLLFVLRLKEKSGQNVVFLALVVAAAWLTNIPSAVMLTYSLGLLLLLAAAFEGRPRILRDGIFAFLLGLGLASFYLLPVLHEQKWVSLDQVLAPGIRPQDNFLFIPTADADHNRFNWLVSAVAAGQIIVLAGAALLARRRIRPLPQIAADHGISMLIAWAALSSLLTLSFTRFAWDHFPELRFVQFPWRWLLCINVGLAMLVTIAWRLWLPRILLLIAMLSLVVLMAVRFQPPWWDTAADIAEMLDNQVTGQGYEGTDEYVPIHADASEVKPNAPLVSLVSGAPLRVRIMRWTGQSKWFSLSASAPGQILVKLFNYPSWKVEINGRQVSPETQEDTGQMLLPVAAGENQVRITFITTQDRILGRTISGIFLLLTAWLLLRQRPGRPRVGAAA